MMSLRGSNHRAMWWPSTSADCPAASPKRDAKMRLLSARRARSRTSRWFTPTISFAAQSRGIRARCTHCHIFPTLSRSFRRPRSMDWAASSASMLWSPLHRRVRSSPRRGLCQSPVCTRPRSAHLLLLKRLPQYRRYNRQLEHAELPDRQAGCTYRIRTFRQTSGIRPIARARPDCRAASS